MGELRHYWIQNNKNDFETILSKFNQRLTERGHNLNDLIPILNQAAATLDSSTSANLRTLFLHWQYHPKGTHRRKQRQLYNEHLASILDYDNMVIAMSRPVNLKDLLTKAALTLETPNATTNMVTRH
jgi:hypothetical protein